MTSNEIDTEQPGLGISLKQSSMMIWALNTAGALFSLFFITTLTRTLPIEDYGTFTLIIRYIGYFTIPAIIFSYWLPRNISRGQNTSMTGIYTSLILGITSVPFYLVLARIFSTRLEQPVVPLMISGILLFFEYVNSSVSAISNGHDPAILGYGQFAFKVAQAVTGYIMVAFLFLGLTGAVLAALFGRIAMTLLVVYMNRSLLKQSRFELKIMKSWFTKSWIPILGSFTCLLYWLDVLIVFLFYKSEIPIAYYGAVMVIVAFPMFAINVASTYYPKIIAKKNLEELSEACWLTLLLSVPIIIFIVIFPEETLAILGINYIPAAWMLRMFAVAVVLQLISGLAVMSYIGLEGKDFSRITSRQLIHTVIFKNNMIELLVNAMYITALALLSSSAVDFITLITLWGVIIAFVNGISIAITAYYIKHDFDQELPLKSIFKYLGYLVIPAIPIVAISLVLQISLVAGFLGSFGRFLALAVFFSILYLGILYMTCGKFRKIARESIRDLKAYSRIGNRNVNDPFSKS